MHKKSLLSLLATTSPTSYALTLPTMKANTSPDQFQLIPESDMPFNLAGQTLPPEQPQETTITETQPDLIP